MLRSIPLQDIMTKKLITLHPKDKMLRVKEIFEDFNIHHIPVVVAGDVVGIISKTDFNLLNHISDNSYDKFIQTKLFITHTVDEYMTTLVYCLTATNTVGDAIDIFLENKISCLPIIDGKKIIGIVTPFDVMRIIDTIK
jgi:CBS domain-containing protein